MGDVFEYIVDGTSGLSPGGTGAILVVGNCSKYGNDMRFVLGVNSDLDSTLGDGALTDCIRDIFSAGGQESIVIAATVGDGPPEVEGGQPVIPLENIMSAIDSALEIYDIEMIHVVGESDSTDWAAFGAKADEMFTKHRPLYFRCEAPAPVPIEVSSDIDPVFNDECFNNYTDNLVTLSNNFSHRFITVCAAYGMITDSTGVTSYRNLAGLLTGRMMNNPVCRAAGRVKDGGINAVLFDSFSEAHHTLLENDGYISAKRYAGLSSPYWGDSKTMAEKTSDYQYEPVVRTVFKAIRLMRIQALKSIYDEAGDPMRDGGAAGINYLKANLELALDTMVKAIPCELAGYVIDIPSNQDIVNNGIAVNVRLIGLPIIREIKLFVSYGYAGTSSDLRG